MNVLPLYFTMKELDWWPCFESGYANSFCNIANGESAITFNGFPNFCDIVLAVTGSPDIASSLTDSVPV